MPNIKPFSVLPGLNPKSLGDSIVNAVAALDRLTAAGWKPVSEAFAYYPKAGAQPSVGLGGALVVDAYAQTMPHLANDPEGLAKAIVGEGNDSELACSFFRDGDPDSLSSMVDAVRVIGCNISSDFERLFDGYESLWPALAPSMRVAGCHFNGDSPDTPATERWEMIVERRWGDLYRKEVEFATPASWKRKRGPVLTHARRFKGWEESDLVKLVLPKAHAETAALLAEYYPASVDG